MLALARGIADNDAEIIETRTAPVSAELCGLAFAAAERMKSGLCEW